MAEDEVVITYGDTTLYKSDVALLQPGKWLNDSLISFWFEYLARERFSEHQDDLLFVDPSAMFMINFSDDVDEVREAMAALELEKRSMILMPINDNDHIDRAGGSHWTLLVFTKRDGKFRYYDSMSAHAVVSRAAKRTAKMVHAVLRGAGNPSVAAVRTPQQSNGSDCGVFVCAVSADVASEHLGLLAAGDMLKRLNGGSGATTRDEIKRALRTVIANQAATESS